MKDDIHNSKIIYAKKEEKYTYRKIEKKKLKVKIKIKINVGTWIFNQSAFWFSLQGR